ncbi:MAG: hypothetical protein AB2552_20025 [Candidatus Thiodiazotropha endolucinida]
MEKKEEKKERKKKKRKKVREKTVTGPWPGKNPPPIKIKKENPAKVRGGFCCILLYFLSQAENSYSPYLLIFFMRSNIKKKSICSHGQNLVHNLVTRKPVICFLDSMKSLEISGS